MSTLLQRASMLVAASLLCGCATLFEPRLVSPQPGPAEQALIEAAEVAVPEPVALPESVTSSLLPPMPASGPDDDAEEPRFDVSVQNTPAPQFFMSLVKDTPYNMIVQPNTTGAISLELKSVTIGQVMEMLRTAYGYEYSYAEGTFQVSTPRIRSQLFTLDYLNIRRAGESQTRVSSGQVSEMRRTDDGDTDGQATSTSVSGSQITTESRSDLWNEIASALRAIVGTGEGRSIEISPNSGIVLVRAMPDELRATERYLRMVEERLQRQVILEAKIIEVTLDDGFQSGINWAYLSEPGRDDSILGTQTGGGTLLGDTGLSEIAGNIGDLEPPSSVLPIATATSLFGGVFTLVAKSDEFRGIIELLETQGDVQVLSSPRIATLNNQKAVIKVGNDEFFVTDVSTTTVTSAATTTNPEVELTPFFSGIALDVTPQISSDGYIILHVHPSVSQVEDQTKTINVGDSTLQLPLAFSTIRETDSVVRARSGQVIVIGGLMQRNSLDRRASIPFISEIPFLSWIFGQNKQAELKKELVILMRPVIVTPGTWQRTIRESVDRVEHMMGRQAVSGRP